MPNKSEIERIAERLSEAQRRALLGARRTPHGNWLVEGREDMKLALAARRLSNGYGDWCRLTELGKSVRTSLQDQS